MLLCLHSYIIKAIIFVSVNTYIYICVINTGSKVSSKTKEQVHIKMKENSAYEIPSSRIKMMENQAYSTLPIANRPIPQPWFTECQSVKLSTYHEDWLLIPELNNRTLKLHSQAYIGSELHRNCFTWLRG